MADNERWNTINGTTLHASFGDGYTRITFEENGHDVSYAMRLPPEEAKRLVRDGKELTEIIQSKLVLKSGDDDDARKRLKLDADYGLVGFELKGGGPLDIFDAGIPLGIVGGTVTPGTYYVLFDFVAGKETSPKMRDEEAEQGDSLLLVEDAETVQLDEGMSLRPVTVSSINTESYAKTAEANRELWAIHSSKLERDAKIADLTSGLMVTAMASIAIEREQERDRDSGKRKRPRKEETINEHVTLTNTKIESAIFGDIEPAKLLTEDAYDGSETTVTLGKLGADTIRLLDDELDLSSGSAIRKAESHLTDDQRFWLTQIQSVMRDNPKKRSVYGSDMLRRAGYKNPLSPNMAETMESACKAALKLTHVSVWIDTTNENRAYRGRKVIRRVEDRRLVEGRVIIEKYDDGSSDFCIEFEGTREQGTTPLPLFDYARDKGEVIDVPSEVFEFGGCGTVTAEHRRVMTYIYRQSMSAGLSDTILFDTMFQRLGINDTRDKRYRLRQKIEKLLDNWESRNPRIIKSWVWKRAGRKIVGVTVHADKSYREKLFAQIELKEMEKVHPKSPQEKLNNPRF